MRRRMPFFDPSSSFAIADFAEAALIKTVGGGPISNGAEIDELTSVGTSGAKLIRVGGFSRPRWYADDGEGRPYAKFDGAKYGLLFDNAAHFASMSGVTLFAVASVDSLSTEAPLLRINGDADARSIAYLAANSATGGAPGRVSCGGRRLTSDTYQVQTSTESISANTPFLVAAAFDYANARIRCYLNGRLYADAPFQTAGTTSPTPAHSVTVGFFAPQHPLNRYLRGRIYMIGIETWALPRDEMVAPLHYMRVKTGIG